MRRKAKNKLFKLLLIIVLLVIVWNKAIPIISSQYDVANILNKMQFSQDNSDVSQTDAPSVSATAAISYDVTDKKFLYEKNIHEKVYPASTTKLLTAQVFADNMNENGHITYTQGAKDQIPNKLDLHVGDVLSCNEAMDAMLIFSANDIAEAIGENVGGSVEGFADKMNDKASKLGLNESNFVNPNGLHNPDHYTTASDLCKIAVNVYKYPWILNTISKRACDIQTPEGNIPIENTNKLLGKDGCIGGKTGFTDEAGKCLVAYYERNGKKMIGIVMHSANDNTVNEDMEKIINWSYTKVSK